MESSRKATVLTAGPTDWLEEAIREAFAVAYGRVFQVFRNQHLAEDAASEACLKALQDSDRFNRDKVYLVRWVGKVAIREAYSIVRRPSPIRLPNGVDVAKQDPPGVEQLEINERVRRCLEKLPEEHQTILVLKDIEGLTFKEIGRRVYGEEDSPGAKLQRARNEYLKASPRFCRLLLEEGISAEEWF